jgi:hypothetical protein
MLLFMDGCQHYATADIQKKWDGDFWAATVNASGGRRAAGSLSLGNQAYVGKLIPQTTTLIFGFWWHNDDGLPISSSLNSSGTHIAKLMALGAQQLAVAANSSGVIGIYRSTTQIAVSASGALPDTGGYVEIKILFSQTVGTVDVRVNGTSVISATGLDTCQQTSTFCDEVQLWGLYAGSSTANHIHDIYICDGTGSLNNNFLGDCRVDTVRPVSDGTTTDFTCSTGTDHYALVDEATPSSTDYNYSNTVNDIDLYGIDTTLATLTTEDVFGVQVNVAALKEDAGARSIAPVARSSSTNVVGDTLVLSTSELYACSVYEQDSTATDWTKTSIEAAEFGAKIVA